MKTCKELVEEMPNYFETFTMCMSEAIGTAILVFVGCMGVIVGTTHFDICVAFGLAIMISIMIFSHVSGAHINPCLSISAAMLGKIPILMCPLYILSQVLGAILGYALLMLVSPTSYFKSNTVCTTLIAPGVYLWKGFLIEYMVSSILIFICCGFWDNRNIDKNESLPLRFGLAITALGLVSGPFTGCSMNPARSFAPALFNWNWTHHWIYWVGPILGTIVTTRFYMVLFSKGCKYCKPVRENI